MGNAKIIRPTSWCHCGYFKNNSRASEEPHAPSTLQDSSMQEEPILTRLNGN